MERIAYGLLELKPDEFFSLTPRQFDLMIKGYKDRERRKAQYLQWLLAPHYQKKLPRIEDITGFPPDKPLKPIEEARREFKELVEQLVNL